MACRHKWVVLRSRIRHGIIVEQDCYCPKCDTVREEREVYSEAEINNREPAALTEGERS